MNFRKAGTLVPAFFLILNNLDKIEENMLKMINKITLLILFAISTIFISSCRQEEQNRVLNYEKGVYLGKKDSKLSEKQITTLKLHTSRQRSY